MLEEEAEKVEAAITLFLQKNTGKREECPIASKENKESIISTGLYGEFKKSAPWPKSVTATYRGNPAETDPARRRFGTSVADLVGRFVGVRFSYDVMALSNSHALQLLTNDTVDIYENDPSLNWRRYQV